MRRKIIGLISICLVIILATLALIRIEKDGGNLEKITVADTTLTSRIYMT